MYKCKVCGYVYDPQKGDPTQGIPENIPFDQLPTDWKCPICDAPTDDFIEI